MKKMRRFAAIAAAAAMTACMAVPMMTAFAEVTTTTTKIDQNYDSDSNKAGQQTPLKLTINDATAGYEYAAYQVFQGSVTETKTTDDVAGTTTTKYSVLTDIKWGANITEKLNADTPEEKSIYTALAAIEVPEAVGSETNVKPFTKADGSELETAAEVAEKLAAYQNGEHDNVLAKKFAVVISQFITGEASNTVDTQTDVSKDTTPEMAYVMENMKPGYYLVENTAVPDEVESSFDVNDVYTPGSEEGAYTRYILWATGDKMTAEEKRSVPEVMKKVWEDTNNITGTAGIGTFTETDKEWNDVADYNIGEKVPFKLYGTMPSTLEDYEHYYYKFTDTIADSFTIEDPANWVIKVWNGATGTEVANNFYNIHKEKTADGLTVTIEDIKSLKDAAGNTITVDDESVITVEYKAELNDKAVIGLNGQINDVYLTYSNNPNVEYKPFADGPKDDTENEADEETDTTPESPDDTGDTPKDTVIVFTYQLNIDKTNAEVTNETTKDQFENAQIAGAEFVLYQKIGTVAYAVILDNSGRVMGWQKGTVNAAGDFTADEVADTAAVLNVGIFNEKNEFVAVEKTDTTNPLVGKNATTLTSGEDGGTYKTMQVIGLDEGEYYLKETKAPVGYNTVTAPITLKIDATTNNIQNWMGASNFEDASKALTKLTLKVGDADAVDALNVDEDLGRNGNATVDNDSIDTGLVWTHVVNKQGTSLPTTGGIGTTLFYVIGGTLAAGAGVALIAKKRMKNEE